jgi:hypothetical protein
VSWINIRLIIECLRELSDRAAQRRLWLSTGQGDVSSFTEAIEQLFTDSGLEGALQKHGTGLGGPAEDALSRLESALARVDRKMAPDRLIDSPQMDAVRQLASTALALIEAPTEGPDRE